MLKYSQISHSHFETSCVLCLQKNETRLKNAKIFLCHLCIGINAIKLLIIVFLVYRAMKKDAFMFSLLNSSIARSNITIIPGISVIIYIRS